MAEGTVSKMIAYTTVQVYPIQHTSSGGSDYINTSFSVKKGYRVGINLKTSSNANAFNLQINGSVHGSYYSQTLNNVDFNNGNSTYSFISDADEIISVTGYEQGAQTITGAIIVSAPLYL